MIVNPPRLLVGVVDGPGTELEELRAEGGRGLGFDLLLLGIVDEPAGMVAQIEDVRFDEV